jgi:hypothetical protein
LPEWKAHRLYDRPGEIRERCNGQITAAAVYDAKKVLVPVFRLDVRQQPFAYITAVGAAGVLVPAVRLLRIMVAAGCVRSAVPVMAVRTHQAEHLPMMMMGNNSYRQ